MSHDHQYSANCTRCGEVKVTVGTRDGDAQTEASCRSRW